MAEMQRSIWCKTEFVAFHKWPSAPDHLDYLKVKHRHVFKVRVEVSVMEHDREVEFHTLKMHLDMHLANVYAGTLIDASCERMAELMAVDLKLEHYTVLQVDVSEDGECGGTVRFANA